MAAIPPTTSATRAPGDGGSSSSSSSGAILAPALLLLLLWGDPTRALRPAASPRRLAPRHARLHAVSARTEAIFTAMDAAAAASTAVQSGGAGGSTTLDGLRGLDAAWTKLKNGGWSAPPPAIVEDLSASMTYRTSAVAAPAYDVCVCGGTLGIFYATVLQNMGYSTCVVERGQVAGRAQEWNISRKELEVLVRLGVLTSADLDAILSIEFNPVRVGFKTDTSPGGTAPGFELYTTDILNLGIKPDVLIAIVKAKYLALGGAVYEGRGLQGIKVFQNVAEVALAPSPSPSPSPSPDSVTARLVLDAMGNGSPISRQVRGPAEPDGICVVVGSCARGFDATNNTYSDVIYTDTPITAKTGASGASSLQYFWEAFPAGSGPTDRTTYLFTYMDAKSERPSVAEILDDYWDLLPRYQGKGVDDLQFTRVLYGMFPTYRGSPLQTTFPRVLAVGDASGIQSPLSFGGFGSLTRHIDRIAGAVKEALDGDHLSADALGWINPYQPNLSACWMFQRAMSCRVGSAPKPGLIVGTLANSFSAMKSLGPDIMNPFLQDVLQFYPLLKTLLLAAKQDPFTPFKVVPQVGLGAIADFVWHFAGMWLYTVLATSVGPLLSSPAVASLPAPWRYRARRLAEAWKFGAGLDYFDH